MPSKAQQGQVLRAVRREKVGERPRQVRQAGYIPAVLYGRGRPTVSLAVRGDEFLRVWEKVGTSTLFDLAVGGRTQKTLIYDVQYDPLADYPIHVDFYAVREDEELETEVPLVFVGEAPAAVELGGTLVKNRDEVLVRALPADLPHEIRVDVSSLKTFDDVIRIKDLKLPPRVELMAEGEEVVANVTPPRSEEELKELEEEVEEKVEEVEVEEKGKEEEAAEEGAPKEEAGEQQEEKGQEKQAEKE